MPGTALPFVLALALCRIAIISILNIHYKTATTATSEFPIALIDYSSGWLVYRVRQLLLSVLGFPSALFFTF